MKGRLHGDEKLLDSRYTSLTTFHWGVAWGVAWGGNLANSV